MLVRMRIRHLAPSLAVAAVLALTGCATNAAPPAAAPAAPTTAPATTPAADDSTCEYLPGRTAARDVEAPAAEPSTTGPVTATMQTSVGPLTLTLDGERTPCTVSSLVSLASQGFYDDVDCHRLTTAGIFVLQCGDPSGTGAGGPGYTYADELDGTETYPAGTIAMANAGPNTNGSQFFLVYEDSMLPPYYTVFGTFDAASVDAIRAVAAEGTDDGQPDGTPKTAVTIQSIEISQ